MAVMFSEEFIRGDIAVGEFESVLYLPVHSPGVWCIAIGATPVMDPWMDERHCVVGIGTLIKICEIGLL